MTDRFPMTSPPLTVPRSRSGGEASPAAGPPQGPTPAAGGPAALAVRGRMTARSGDPTPTPPVSSAAGPRLPAGAVLVEDAAPAGGIRELFERILLDALAWRETQNGCGRCEPGRPCPDCEADETWAGYYRQLLEAAP
jgi:hypothetical protein